MEKIAIITDTCGDIPKEIVEELNIEVIPITVQYGEESLRDGIDISADEVYELQKTHIMKTASPAGNEIQKVFDKLISEEYTHAIALMLSEGLSSTVNQIRLFASTIEEMEVAVYNSKSAALGEGMIAIAMAGYRNLGMSFKELKKKAEKVINDSHVFFSIDTLEFLEKGGRIGKATAFVGSALKIKPIMSLDQDGEIYVPAKVRGSKKVFNKLIEMISELVENNPGRKYVLLVADGGCVELRDELLNKMKELFPDYLYAISSHIGASLACYLGPNLLGAGIQFLD